MALAEERLKSQKEIHELHAQIANVEILHAKGLLTARGVFERAAHLAFFEMNLKGAVNTTQALREVGNASKLGVWTQHLRDAAAHCAPKEQTSDLLISVWQELSLDVHGFSWKGPDVQFSASLSEQAKCVVEELCKKNGLENKESVINTFHRSCAQRKKESACLNYHALDNRRTQTSCHLREGPLFPASTHTRPISGELRHF